MDAWVIWLIVAVVFAVAEVINLSFYLFPFAIGARGRRSSRWPAGLRWPRGSSSRCSPRASFTIVRPIARRHINMPPQLRTGTAALIGRTAIVTERIVNDEAVGQVRLDGEVWSARAYDEDKVLEPGTRVHVMEIRGATALVDD